METPLRPVSIGLEDIPRLLRELADDLLTDMPRAGRILAAERLYEVAADIDALGIAYRAKNHISR